MSAIILPDKWRRQPSGVGTSLDISDSARGVIACYVPSAGYVDIASGKRMQGTASPNFRPGVSGISTQTTGAAGAFIGCPTYGTIASGSDRTVMAVFAIDTYPPSQLASVVGFSNSIPRGSDAVSSWNVLGVGSTGTVQYAEYDGSTKYASGQTISTGKVVCAIGTAVSGVGIRVAVDGVVGSLTSMGTLAAINSAGLASNFTDIYGPLSARHFAGQIYLMCGWNRALSAPELADLSVNPWQIFRKSPRVLYFPSAGGGGATLTVQDLAQGHSLGSPTLTEHNVLAANALSQAQSLGAPSLTQAHVLAVDGIALAHSLGNVTLTQAYSLIVQALSQAHSLDEPALTQHNVLVVDALGQAQILEAPSLTAAGALAVDAMAQAQSLGLPSLVQHHVLAVDALAQAQAFGSPSLTQAHILTPDALAQAQTTGNVSFTIAASLAVQAIAQAQAFGSPDLAQHHVLTPDAVVQAQ